MSADRPRLPEPTQRQLTTMAGERVAEMLSWRTTVDLAFAVVIWPRTGGGKATTYVSTQEAALAMKLCAAVANDDD
jgi:hypothetical protein